MSVWKRNQEDLKSFIERFFEHILLAGDMLWRHRVQELWRPVRGLLRHVRHKPDCQLWYTLLQVWERRTHSIVWLYFPGNKHSFINSQYKQGLSCYFNWLLAKFLTVLLSIYLLITFRGLVNQVQAFSFSLHLVISKILFNGLIMHFINYHLWCVFVCVE